MRGLAVTALLVALCSTAQAQAIAFVGTSSGVKDLYVLRGGVTQKLTTGGGLSGDVNWSPSGDKIVFTQNNLVYRINADGTNQVQLSPSSDVTSTTGDISPDWINGGTIIYTHMTVPGGNNSQRWSALYTMSAVDGSDQTFVVGNGTDVFDQAHISPDATQYVYDSDHGGTKNVPNVWKCQVSSCSTTSVQLTNYTSAASPTWSRDGTKILMEEAQSSLGGNVEIATVSSSDGSGFTALTSFTEPSGDPGEPAYSQDGTQIILALDNCTGSSLGTGCYGQGDPAAPTTIWTMNANGSNEVNTGTVSAVAGSPRWQPSLGSSRTGAGFF